VLITIRLYLGFMADPSPRKQSGEREGGTQGKAFPPMTMLCAPHKPASI